MKNQALFSSKDKSKKLKCRLLQFLIEKRRNNCKFLVSRTKYEVLFLLSITRFIKQRMHFLVNTFDPSISY